MKRKRLIELQTEYNELYNRLGYTRNEANIAAINRRLDELADKMNKLIK